MTVSNLFLQTEGALDVLNRTERAVATPRPAPGLGFRKIMVVIASEDTAAHCIDSAMMFFSAETSEIHFMSLATRVAPELPDARPVRNGLATWKYPKAVEVFLHQSVSIEPEQDIRRLAYSFEIDLIVMVAHPGPGLLSVFLKRADERILRAAPCPVVAVPCPSNSVTLETNEKGSNSAAGKVNSAGDKNGRNLLACLRSHERAEHVVQFGTELAEKWNCALNILVTAEFGNAGEERTDQRPIQIAQDLLDEWVPQHLQGSAMGASNIAFFESVRQSARGCAPELLLVGGQHRFWQANHRIDLNTERIVRGSSAPVLCVPNTLYQ
jgi:nucleotide-binding universal stress UspA family protein